MRLQVKWLLLFVQILPLSSSETASAVGRLQQLRSNDDYLNRVTQDFIISQEKILDDLRRHLKDSHPIIIEKESDFSHPVDQVSLILNFHRKWSSAWDILQESESQLKYLAQDLDDMLPAESELDEATRGLFRLQKMYKLPVNELASGRVFDFPALSQLSRKDVFEIGVAAYRQQDYSSCADWMQKSLDEPDLSQSERLDILDYLHFCLYKAHNVAQALKYAEQYLTMDDSNERVRKNFEWILEEFHSGIPQIPEPYISDEMQIYNDLCTRNGTSQLDSSLHCFFDDNHDPRLLLQPVKVELLSNYPYIVMWHDFVSDSEIDTLKILALPNLDRATVQTDRGEQVFADYRVSQTSWLEDSEDAVVDGISKRISAMTNLSMETAESLQISNYGIGGQYEPHYDFATDESEMIGNGWNSSGVLNRVATTLIYLSDVTHGGDTVFLRLGLSVRPVKGSAVFWYNQHPDGSGIFHTRHAACPVLLGIKWVANKWLHYGGQQFRYRC